MGTPSERLAARYLAGALHSCGLHLVRQPFCVSHFPAEVGSRVIFFLCAVLVVAGLVVADALPLLATAFWVLVPLLVNRSWLFFSQVARYWPPTSVTENLLASPPAQDESAPARVIFMAHYDTKSQFVPTGVRVGLVTGVTVLTGLLAVVGLARALGVWELSSSTAFCHFAVPSVVMLAGLVANYSGNRSPGALDNGSGIGTLLELARTWRPRPGAPVDVVWVATGSEELGLYGARRFVAGHEHWWREKPTLLINLESVGAGPSLYLAGLHASVHFAEQVADRLGLTHAQLHVLGAGMDHEPFAARGLESLSILGDVVRRSFKMHSARDNMQLIEPWALERAGRFAAELAWAWAEKHQPAATMDSVPDLSACEETPVAWSEARSPH